MKTDYTAEGQKTTAYRSEDNFSVTWQRFSNEVQLALPNFKIDAMNKSVIESVLAYFASDRVKCQNAGLNLQKGLLLSGPVGCGKTTLMRLFSRQRYRIISTREISRQFIQNGHAGLEKYGAKSFVKKHTGYGKQICYDQPITYCFDDLGVEPNAQHFGNECNAMAEVLLDRYEQFISRGMLTHMTTNLNTHEIENLYGDRVRSRLREMFNLVSFPREAKDRRR
ncbi:ATPase [Catalinimonas sp. 4WD22]|uniref:ATP-binding protein n=1 Tax=Catalinimonas locisalis TaxID=3133978 RepID=UPI003100BA8C